MEDSVITFNVFHHVAWGTSISIYFWLVGASAGSFVISSFGWVFNIKRYKQLALTASLTAIFMLLLVPILLIWDLGKPVRFIYLLLPSYWHATGPMSWGTVLILTYPMAMIVYTIFVMLKNEFWARTLGIIAIVLALSTHWYTGVVMELNPGRFLNHTALAPLLFLTGAFISGIGLLILILWVQNMIVSAAKRIDWKLIEEMAQYMMYGIIFDAFLLFLEFLQSIYGSSNAVLGHEAVLMGVFRFPYLWMEIIIGLIIPFFILVTPLKKRRLVLVAAAYMVCFGVYGMRIWWVMGGQYLQTFY
ncbi:MAG: polysulfide reductase NrfD [Rhodospirillaceae bacterium]|jgi:dimethyl sulfoxide reductase membrane subunit|nr:polysulfide reductase NrfD [Rhodospirillaceae bacterium]MBT7955582.1 polysulfide reductase NrfD [Rhodospirillaceae bacterium]